MVQSLMPFAQNTFRQLQPSLEPLETSSHAEEEPSDCGTPESLALDETFRHSGWAHTRRLTDDSLQRSSASLDRILQFQGCGSNAWVEQSVDSPTSYRIRCNRCHDRFCLPCGQERSRVIAHNVHERLDVRKARMISLTLRSDTEPLQYLLDHLYASFARLRRTRLWSQTQDGGAAMCEIKWSAKKDRWHPHLHILSEGRYIAQKALSTAWRKATGDSFIVDVRKIHDSEEAVRYITKYASKPHDASIWRVPARLDEAVTAMKGRRLCLTYGTWRGVKLTDVPDPGTWTPLAPLARLILQARAGEPAASQILSRLPGAVLPDDCRAPPDESPPDDSSQR